MRIAPEWFAGMAAIFETAHLEGDNPRAQSGFGGDEARWEAGRRPITKAIDRGGTFLDIGCASGYLMESLVRWSPHRIEPYGLELAPAIADLARSRLPQWADRIFVGNALTWQPPRRFDFVRTELVYVPELRQRALVERLLDGVVHPAAVSSSAATAVREAVCRPIPSGGSSAPTASSPSSNTRWKRPKAAGRSSKWRCYARKRGSRYSISAMSSSKAGPVPFIVNP